MLKQLGALLTVVALASPVVGQTDLDNSFPKDSPITFEELHRAVSSGFLDPRSAQYKGFVHLSRKPAQICGWVNARNSAGGYTPFYPFYVSLSDMTVNVGQNISDPILGPLSRLAFQYTGCSTALGLPSS